MKTVLYYTSNREDPAFEDRIVKTMLENKGDLPVISVSQKPMDLGHNICVGDVGLSYINEWRQIMIGAKEAKTEYLVLAESDFLYPEEYFNFEPKGADVYRYDNVWVVWKDDSRKPVFHRKRSSEGAQIVKREYFIDLLENKLKGRPEWCDEYYLLRFTYEHEFIHGKIPCVSFKTGNGVRLNTNTSPGKENATTELPFWGDISELKNKFL